MTTTELSPDPEPMNATIDIPAAETPTDVPANLTSRLPLGLRAPAKLLHDSAGIDPASAIVLAASALTAWAGDQLRVRVPGGISLPTACSLLMGLPPTVDPTRLDQVIFDALVKREESVLEVLREHQRTNRPLNCGAFSAKPEETSLCSLLRNPDTNTLEQAEACSGFDQLLVMLSGPGWIEKSTTNRDDDAGQHLRTLLSMSCERHSRIVRPTFRGPRNRTLGQIMVCVIATAPEHLVRAAAGARGEYNILKRSLLRHAPRFCVEQRPLNANPLGPVTGPESRSWDDALQRATCVRTGKEFELVPDSAATASFTAWESRITAELQAMEPLDACELRTLRNLPYRLYAGFRLALGPGESAPGIADLAIDIAETIWRRAIAMYLAAAEENAESELDANAARLLRHLQDFGPLRRRDLMRKQSVQKLAHHEPALRLLIDSGRIHLDEFNRFATVTPEAAVLN